MTAPACRLAILAAIPCALLSGTLLGLLAPAYLTTFLQNFYNFDVLGGKRISSQVVEYGWNVAVGASPKGTLDCVTAQRLRAASRGRRSSRSPR